MKNILWIMALFAFLKASGQPIKPFDGKKWEAPYSLDIPKDWDVERFLIPIQFAPVIPYKGVEDIRFTPGWGKIATNEYWTYAFLWWLDNTPKFNAKIIKNNLIAYYTGLINVNIDKSKVSVDKLVQVKASVKKTRAEKGDLKTFTATVEMLDFISLKPITLNLIIHIKSCADQNKIAIFHEVSPRAYTDDVWKSLHQLWLNFACTKS